MANIVVEKAHTLSPDEAREALKPFEQDIAKFGLKPAWRGDRAELKGTGVSGEIRVEANRVVVELKLGMLAKAAGIKPDRIKASIEKRLNAALG